MITFEAICANQEIRTYMLKGHENLGVMGFTEHGLGHAMKCAKTAGDILLALGHDAREVELARMAGYMHDIGNCINRCDHAHSGGLMAMMILRDLRMNPAEVAVIAAAIGNHDEKTGTAVDAVAAALILADKTDVRRSRVRGRDMSDIHDRVNYAVVSSRLNVDAQEKVITLDIDLDTQICPVLDYFEIFTERMLMCRRAAQKIGCTFSLKTNGSTVL